MLQYECYKYNIYHLIKYYGYKPHWFKIDEFPFEDHSGSTGENFEMLRDKCLMSYKDNKLGLAEDILKRGMYTPFFYITIDDKRVIYLGRHRLYSLLKYHNTIEKIDKEFLFIEIPRFFKQNEKNTCIQSLYIFTRNSEIWLEKPLDGYTTRRILANTGDNLSGLIYGKDIEPFSGFNNKNDFEIFLKKEMKGEIEGC